MDAPADPGTNPPRVCLVLGGGQGIGRGTADSLCASGWTVHVNVRDEVKRRDAAEAFGEGFVHGGDLTVPGAAADVVAAVLERDGRLDAVVHAVGPYMTLAFSETSADEFRRMWEGNVGTALAAMDAARGPVREAGGAWVFFGCAGLDRWRARKVTGAYISAKAALLAAMRAFALEEASHGVRVNMISPGFVPHSGAAPDTVSQELHDMIPIGRAARMDEVTGAVRWLVSPEAAHVVGQNLEVAGGWML
ncbi:MAG: SDR family oxidoreductase [Planctomycetota bacterium]